MLFAITFLLGWSTFCPQTMLTLLPVIISCYHRCWSNTYLLSFVGGAVGRCQRTYPHTTLTLLLLSCLRCSRPPLNTLNSTIHHSPSSLPLIDVKISSLQLWKDVKLPITSFLSTIFPVTWFCCWLLPGRRLPNHWRQVTAQRQGESTRWGGGRVTNVKNAEFATAAVCFESDK